MKYKTGIGQDSHRFLADGSSKPCMIGGVVFEKFPGFNANSDGDVVFHAICNAITSVTGVMIMGGSADELCLQEGITDSSVYLLEAMKTLKNDRIEHVAITLECKRPIIKEAIPALRKSIADVMDLRVDQVGVTATSGEGLTDFGCGLGVQCFAIVTIGTNP